MKKENKAMSCMYNMPPPWFMPGYGLPPTTPSSDSWEKALKFFEKLEKKKAKKEGEKKPDPKKDGPSAFHLFVFMTMITPFVGMATVWSFSFMLRMTFQNLQAIVPH